MWQKRKLWLWSGAGLLIVSGAAALCLWWPPSDDWSVLEGPGAYPVVEIQHPLAGAVLPLNMPAPVLFWRTNLAGIDRWVAGIKAGGRKWLFTDIHPLWRPSEVEWRKVKETAGTAPI
jgi:hypothetical protein